MFHERFRIAGTNETVLEFSDLMNVTLRGDDVQGFFFLRKWDEVLSSMRDAPKDDMLESMCMTKPRDSEQIMTTHLLCRIKIQCRRMNQEATHA